MRDLRSPDDAERAVGRAIIFVQLLEGGGDERLPQRHPEKLGVQLTAAGLDAYRIEFPKGMDANDYALKVTPAAKSLGLVIRNAHWLGKGEAPMATFTSTVVPIPVTEEAAKEEISASAEIAPSTIQHTVDAVLPASPMLSPAAADIEAHVRGANRHAPGALDGIVSEGAPKTWPSM